MPIVGLTPILNVGDVPASLAWFERLGWRRNFTWNHHGMIEGAADANAGGPAHFAGLGCGKAELFLCRNGQGGRGRPAEHADDEDTGGVWMSWWLESPAEVDDLHARALAGGVRVVMPPTDEPWGVRECRLQTPDGHMIRLSAGIAREDDCAP